AGGSDEPAQSIREADRSHGQPRPRAIPIEANWHVVGESSAHDSCAGGRRCRMGELLGIAHLRAERPMRVMPPHRLSQVKFRCCAEPSRRLVIGVACVAALMLICSSVARAHEIGTTRVAVLFQADRSYQIEIITDATALLEKLQASAGRAHNRDKGSASPQALLATFDDICRRRLKVAFDGSDVRPGIEYSVSLQTDNNSLALATIRLAGEIPPGARHFTWTYSWTFASYALTFRSDHSETQITQWLEGGQTSRPFVLSGAVPRINRIAAAWRYFTLGFTHIV